MTGKKLIFVGFGKKVEMSYIPEDIFAKLMAKGHVRWDGMWISNPSYWAFFFEGWARFKAGML